MNKAALPLIATGGFTKRAWDVHEPDSLTRKEATQAYKRVGPKMQALSGFAHPSGMPTSRAFASADGTFESAVKAYDELDAALLTYEQEVKKEVGWQARLKTTVKGIGIYREQLAKGRKELGERFHAYRGGVQLEAMRGIRSVAPNESRKATRAAKAAQLEAGNAKGIFEALERDLGRSGVDPGKLDQVVKAYLRELDKIAAKGRKLAAEGVASRAALDTLDRSPGSKLGWARYPKLVEMTAADKRSYLDELAALRKELDDAMREVDEANGVIEDSRLEIDRIRAEANRVGLSGARRERLKADASATLDATLGEIAAAARNLEGAQGLLKQFDDDKPAILEVDSDAYEAAKPVMERRLAEMDRVAEAAKGHISRQSEWKRAGSAVPTELRGDPELRALTQAVDDELGEVKAAYKALAKLHKELQQHYALAIEGKEPGAA